MKNSLLLFLLLITLTLNAQNPADIDLVVGSGYVDFHNIAATAIQPDGKIIVGGSFYIQTGGAHYEGRVARFNTDGSIDTGFTVPLLMSSGVIKDVLVQPDGKILVAGNFSTMNGEAAGYLIRLNADGSKDETFNGEAGNAVHSIALQQDGKVVVSGIFSGYINGHQQSKVLRLNTDGTKDDTFDFGFAGFDAPNSSVYKVAVQSDGKVLAGGTFTSFNGEPQGMIIRFNADGTKDTSFDIGAGTMPNSQVRNIIEQPDGKILLSSVTNWNGDIYKGVIRLNNNGSIDPSFTYTGGSYNDIKQIALKPNGKIIVVGRLTINEEQIRVICLNSDGTLDTSFSLIQRNSNGTIRCVKVQADGKIVIGGDLKEYDGVMKNSFARLNIDGTIDTTFNLDTGLNDEVTTIALQDNGKTLLGGNFTSFQGVSQNRIISLNDDGSINASFTIGSGFNHAVRKIVTQPDGKILVGGDFTEFNGEPANHIIRLNSDGSKDNTFDLGSGFNNYVQTIAVQPDGKVLIGGRFTIFNGQTQKYFVRLNADGSKDTSFEVDESFNHRVTHIEMQADDKIFVAGNFTTFNGEGQRFLISLNPDGSKDTSFDVGTSYGSYVTLDYPTDIILDIAIQVDGKILILSFSGWYQDQNVGSPLRIHSDGAVDEDFESNVIFSHGSPTTMAVQTDGKILIGGTYYTAHVDGEPGAPYNRIMRLHANGGKDESFDINEGHEPQSGGFYQGGVNDIVIDADEKIWVGGNFFHYRLESSFAAIRLVGEGTPLSVEDVEFENMATTLFPNPVKDILYINETVKTLKITDLNGKTLAVKKDINEVDMSNYPSGLYLITTENENGVTETQKIVKE